MTIVHSIVSGAISTAIFLSSASVAGAASPVSSATNPLNPYATIALFGTQEAAEIVCRDREEDASTTRDDDTRIRCVIPENTDGTTALASDATPILLGLIGVVGLSFILFDDDNRRAISPA